MKKLLYILALLFPIATFAQQPWYKSSLDYAWKSVGQEGFTRGVATFSSLAFNPADGLLYVAYMDYANSEKATVQKFDGTNWVNVGNPGFSTQDVAYVCLAFSPSGQPYVAFTDCLSGYKASAMKFDGTNWVNVGNADFSEGSANYMSLAFNPVDSKPYVSFEGDYPYPGATCMKFNGTDWIYVGTENFSKEDILYTNMTFSPIGEPYVGYMDWGNSGKATVMKYDSVMVGITQHQESGLLI